MIRYLNLPQIPVSLVSELTRQYDQYMAKASYANGAYVWSDSFNDNINAWCKSNICDSMYWGFQIMSGDIPAHVDRGTEIKLTYVIDCGGGDVITSFYDQNDQVTHCYCIQPNRWHIFQANCMHSVTGIEPGHTRFSITGRVFPQ